MFDDEGVFDNPLFLAYRARILSLAEKHGLAVMGARESRPYSRADDQ